MNLAVDWFQSGGPVMPALLIVGVLLYTLLFERALRMAAGNRDLSDDSFTVIRALIGAAPLLGLLGTVGGLIGSFDALVDEARIREVGVGIGHALRTTQYGMALAAPALLLERVLHGAIRRADVDRSETTEGA